MNSLPLLQSFLRRVTPLVTPFNGCAACPARPLPFAERRSAVAVQNSAIDIVYTWVDGSDSALREKKQRYMPLENAVSSVSHGKALYRDNQELRFSLRSIEAYLPWVRYIHIVTDNQIPAWLDEAHPKIRIVDHTDIIPAHYLPTFSSRVIEAFLHKIPGLAEQYIYCNDDVFFAAQTTPDDFFTANGLPYIFTDWRRPRRLSYAKSATPHSRSHANVIQYLAKKGVVPTPGLITAHGPFAQTRKNAEDVFRFFEPAIEVFAQDKFRSMRGMVFYCHMAPLWAYAKQRGVACDLAYYYINTKRLDRKAYYGALLKEQNSDTIPMFFCLNDPADSREWYRWQEDYSDFVHAFYPKKSSFEKHTGS